MASATSLDFRPRIVDNIEYKTGKKVAINTNETEKVLAKCHPQDQCPLFQLPMEMRDLIWEFATTTEEDQDNKYATTEYYYRPGNTSKLKTTYNVLLTCRRIWLEAHPWPMLQAEHSFWYYRGAPDGRSKEWMTKLTPLNRKYFGTLHLYAQMFAIEPLTAGENQLRTYFLNSHPRTTEDFQPRVFHVTIRHTDWWYWENDEPLRFENRWFQAMLDTPDLRRTETLKLELETLDYKVRQLNPIVERIKNFKSEEYETHVIDGKPAKTKFVLDGGPEITTWSGPTNIDGEDFEPYQDKKKLEYHVVTLTWRLKFPDHPRAHIPDARLAPRIKETAHSHIHPTTENPYSSDTAILRREREERFLQQFQQNDDFARRSGRIRRFPPRSGGSLFEPFRWSRDLKLKAQRSVFDGDAFNAKFYEACRRDRFWEGMRLIWDGHWMERFESQQSLLSLEEA